MLLARGGKGVPSPLGLVDCSAAYWAVTAAGFLLLLGVSLASGRRLVARAQLNEVRVRVRLGLANRNPNPTPNPNPRRWAGSRRRAT